MKRDLDFIRELLLFIEESNSANIPPNEFLQLTDDFDKICYHLHLLYESSYIEAYDITCIGYEYPQYQVRWLTNEGCDYLDAVRSNSVWDKTKDFLTSTGSSAALDTVKAIAGKITMSLLESSLLR